jgi:transcriptional regulator with GAF, ATPase, and Fis domain
MSSRLLDEDLRGTFEWLGFVTSSPRVLSVLCQARKAAEASDITVLLEGETGTGKQVIAHGIHRLDQKRKSSSFITVHCSTINESLAESELFGHHRWAFSCALFERMGLFQAAHRGTLFLDDINDLPSQLQPKLLDVVRGTVRLSRRAAHLTHRRLRQLKARARSHS